MTEANEKDLERAALLEVLREDWGALSSKGDQAEEAGFTFKVEDVRGQGKRRWSEYTTIYLSSSSGRHWSWGYDRALTEIQEHEFDKSFDLDEVTRHEEQVIKVTYRSKTL